MVVLIRVTLALIVVCTGSVGLVRLANQTQSLAITILFANPDGTLCERPCLFGIQPGQTRFPIAAALLRAHPFTQHLKPNLEGDIFGDQGMVVIMERDASDRVASIELLSRSSDSPISEVASLGEVIDALGPPNLVVSSAYTTTYYFSQRLKFSHRRVTARRIGIYEPFYGLTMYAEPPKAPSSAVLWQGFRKDL